MLGIRTKIRHVSASLKWAKANEHNRTQLGRWVIGLDNVTIGDYSYGEINVLTASKQPKLAIGELCSIAPNVTFVIHNNHPIDHFTTFPLRRFVLGETYDEACGDGGIVVEEDVWIGYGATILDGVHIGRGGGRRSRSSRHQGRGALHDRWGRAGKTCQETLQPGRHRPAPCARLLEGGQAFRGDAYRTALSSAGRALHWGAVR